MFQERFSRQEVRDNLSTLQAQVDEVKDVMTQNIEKVLERGERLDDLMDKTTDLEASVSFWWENKDGRLKGLDVLMDKATDLGGIMSLD